MAKELVLHNRAVLDTQGKYTSLLLGIFLIAMAAAVFIWLTAAQPSEPVEGSVTGERVSSIARGRTLWLELVLLSTTLVAHFAYLSLSKRRERLILTDLGIRYVSPFPAALQFVKPNWSLQWSQIRRAEVKPGNFAPGPAFLSLVLDAGTVKRSIRPYLWVDPATHRPPSWEIVLKAPARTVEALTAEALNSPVLQFVQKIPHLKFELPDPTALRLFALEKNGTSLIIVALFFVSIAYAFCDALIFNSESYVEAPSYGVYFAGGAAYGLLGLWFMRHAKVPLAESVIVALLAGAGFGAALYPGLLRINQVTDAHGLSSHDYKMTTPANFVPVQQGLPQIYFPTRHAEFWSSYPAGHTEKFELRKGGLGFYQLDMAPIYDRIREHYETSRKRPK